MSSGTRRKSIKILLGLLMMIFVVSVTALLYGLTGVIANKNKTLQQYQNELEYRQEVIDSLNVDIAKLNERLQSISDELEIKEKEVEDYKSGKLNVWGFDDKDVDLLNRLVESEAGGESMEGRIAVANVVLNRIKSDKYPNTLHDVIYQKNQFEVVKIGTINTKIPSEGTKEAVRRALQGESTVPEGTVIFWAKYVPSSHPIWRHCDVVKTIGIHNFATSWD